MPDRWVVLDRIHTWWVWDFRKFWRTKVLHREYTIKKHKRLRHPSRRKMIINNPGFDVQVGGPEVFADWERPHE